jgi:putative DNA methylase
MSAREAQRLGLESHASDLNPVAVLINKAMIEIPPRFAGRGPIGPIPSSEKQSKMVQDWSGTNGLAEDIRRYSVVVRDAAFKQVGHLFPQIAIPKEKGAGKSTVIAWLWARTVKSPNPAFAHVDVPLAATFVLSGKSGKEAYIKPIIDGDKYRFEVRTGTPPESAKNGTKAPGRGANFICLLSGTPIGGDYIKAEGQAGRMGSKLMAVVAEYGRGRTYISPSEEMESCAKAADPDWYPNGDIPKKLSGGTCVPYGMTQWGDLFTKRQLSVLGAFSSALESVEKMVLDDALAHGWEKGAPLDTGGLEAQAYAQAIVVYLSFCRDKLANWLTTISHWWPAQDKIRPTFTRQALPMTWDYSEANPFAGAAGDFLVAADGLAVAIANLPSSSTGFVSQQNCQKLTTTSQVVFSTDPPYYDNIFYADLSDFFYVWLRRSLKSIYPSLFGTIAAPKSDELVAVAHRHGSKEAAEKFFLDGMTEAMTRLVEQATPSVPTTIYYAFKQSDTTDMGTGNTGWETFLEAVLRAGFAITGTWPMRTENSGRMVGQGANALASSIVLVCRKRERNAPTISRRDFLRDLKDELAEAVEVMIGGAEGISPVAPVDLAQAVIGPGMAIFSKYSAVLEADGSPMTVHTALTLINRMLTEGGDEFDSDTQFCLGWFDENGWATGEFGKADVLARAKGTSVDGVRDAGVVEAGSGKVRLLKPAEYAADWNPEEDNRTPVWEALHQMIRMLQSQGESAAGALLARMPERAEPVRSLAYRLYTLCERKGWAEEARGYNELITSWLGIEAASHEAGHLGSQAKLDI